MYLTVRTFTSARNELDTISTTVRVPGRVKRTKYFRMRNLFVLTAAAAVLFGAAVAGRLNETPLQTAALDWERGDYISALDTYLRVLDSSTSPADLDAIALQTGELYRTTELTTDGALPRFSPDGRTLLYESGPGLARLTRLLPANGSTVAITELHGFGAVYSPDGTRIAYLAVRTTPELTNAEAAIEQGPSADRPRRQAAFNELVAAAARIVVRNLDTGRESEVPLPGFSKAQLAYGAGGVWFSGKGPGDEAVQIYEAQDDGRAAQRTSGPQDQLIVRMNATGTALLCAPRVAAGNAALQRADPRTFTIIATASGHRTTMSGFAPAFSGDGGTLTFVSRNEDGYRLMVAPIAEPVTPSVVRTGTEPIDAPALTRDGSRLAFQMMSKDDWEIYTINRDGTAQVRVSPARFNTTSSPCSCPPIGSLPQSENHDTAARRFTISRR